MSATESEETRRQPAETQSLQDVVIRFAGDSGDGMQLTGNQFTRTSALVGNDLATLPEFPAEIRAPQGTLAGVSAFQVRIAEFDIHTPGDEPDVLVAMNPAALAKTLRDLKANGILIVNTDEFSERNLKKAGYESNPLEDGSLEGYRVFTADITTMTRRTLEDTDLEVRTQDRCKNFFALGMIYWMFNRPLEKSIEWAEKKFSGKPEIADANVKALKAGWNFCDITGVFQARYEVPPAKLAPGTYRNVMGNQALSMGLVAAARLADLPLFLGSYPITPASDILHQLAGYKNYDVTTFQAEDEIAAVCAAIGASFGGALAVTTTSGPGLALKSEAVNLAVMTELPLVVVDVQRAGPSTGMPTSTEQSDLLQAMFGRNGESPVPIVAAASPGDCFEAAVEACRIAIKYRVPVLLMSDGYLANGAEPWRLPNPDDLESIDARFASPDDYVEGEFQPYARDERTLARPWAIPGTAGLEHRIGGLEKEDLTGNVSYDPDNHQRMTDLRAEKVARIAQEVPDLEIHGDVDSEVLVLGWGSTRGAVTGAATLLNAQGHAVAHAHLRHLNPFPKNLGEVLERYSKVIVPEVNMGQLSMLLRARYLKDVISLPKVEGKPFLRSEIVNKVLETLGHSTQVH